jgi:hypothetical protein
MCKASTPKYEQPPEYSRPLEPDNEALYSEAMTRASMRGGGSRRGTILTGLRGTTTPPVLGAQTGTRSATTLG